MTKTLTVLAALGAALACSTTASAYEVRVSLVGKDLKTIQADINRAAREVCNKELSTKSDWIASYARCVDETVARAMAVLPAKAS
jgi:UrcA family protein